MGTSAQDVLSGNAGNGSAAQDSQDISPIQVYQSLMNGLQPQAQQIIQQPAQQVPGMDQGAVQVQPQQPMGTMRRLLTGALMGLASGAGHTNPQADPSGIGPAFAAGFGNEVASRQNAVNQQNAALLAARQENRTQGAFQTKEEEAQGTNLMAKISMAKALFESSYFPDELKATMEKPITDWTAKVTDDGLMNIDQSFDSYEALQHAVFNAQRAGHPEYPGRLPNGQYVMLSPAKSGYSSSELADTLQALGIGDPQQVAQLRKQNLTYTPDTFGRILTAAGGKYSADHKAVNDQLQADLLRAKIAEARAQRDKLVQETQSDAQVRTPGLFGDHSPLDGKAYNQLQGRYKTNVDALSKTDQSYEQFMEAAHAALTGNVTGAQSVVALFNAIGLSATPLKGAGFRINNNTVEEHSNARSLGESLYQKLLRVKAGDVITPQQILDYYQIAQQSRTAQYVAAINQVRGVGLKPDFLMPRGNGRYMDAGTAQIFLAAANGDKNLARQAAGQLGWRF